ncbi:MAG TPA: AmmeMemoRadiSam system radical SAM enzyme [Spirochaetota bacterium]|nr:AmmeMemoRadiSam system radical SAM enzyme [Spirochaetota bacterium]
MSEPALYFSKNNSKYICDLCPHSCVLTDSAESFCRVRGLIGGKPSLLSYGMISSIAVDPIEKKPLYHFYPGSQAFSIGSYGCNLRCPYCQNWQISQSFTNSSIVSPRKLVDMALESGAPSIAYTYSEPLIWYEYIYDCAQLAKEAGLNNILVTNGYIHQKPFEKLLPHIDALNIDLKSFNKNTYKSILKGELEVVLENIKMAVNYAHVELTTLVVTGMNDDMSEMQDACRWIASLDKNMVWHVSRYFPSFQYNKKSTDVSFIEELYVFARSILAHVYTGNMHAENGMQNSYCASCGKVLIDRNGYSVRLVSLKNGRCDACGHPFEAVLEV